MIIHKDIVKQLCNVHYMLQYFDDSGCFTPRKCSNVYFYSWFVVIFIAKKVQFILLTRNSVAVMLVKEQQFLCSFSKLFVKCCVPTRSRVILLSPKNSDNIICCFYLCIAGHIMTTIVMLKPCVQTNQSKLIYLVPRTKTGLLNFLIGVMCTHCAIPVIVTICLTRQL